MIRNSAGVYTFTIPAHPDGVNYMIYVQQTTVGNAAALALYYVSVISNTSFIVYSKSTTSNVSDSNFFVRTVP
jgi:hypothetical protein